MALAPLLFGSLASHPLAPSFAAEVARVHRRYAAEVVAAHRLCPFLRDVDVGFGRFCVVLEPPRANATGASGASGALPPELDVATAVAAVQAAQTSVVHIVYPLARPPAALFEKFAAKIGEALKASLERPPVMATFHPELSGDTTDPYRLIGVLRRAPDPFVQMIPEGLHEGGTVFASLDELPELAPAPPPAPPVEADTARATFARLQGGALAEVLARLDDIQADRARSYAPFLAALGRG